MAIGAPLAVAVAVAVAVTVTTVLAVSAGARCYDRRVRGVCRGLHFFVFP